MVFPNINELTWNQFCSMPGIDKLPLNEQARQYQLYCEEIAQFKFTYSNAAPTGGGGISQIQEEESIPAGCIQFVVNTTEGTYFEFSVTSNTNEFTYTVNWGDGVIEEGASGEGNAGLNHTYPDGVADYTVRVCFDDASIIHDINFPGFD